MTCLAIWIKSFLDQHNQTRKPSFPGYSISFCSKVQINIPMEKSQRHGSSSCRKKLFTCLTDGLQEYSGEQDQHPCASSTNSLTVEKYSHNMKSHAKYLLQWKLCPDGRRPYPTTVLLPQLDGCMHAAMNTYCEVHVVEHFNSIIHWLNLLQQLVSILHKNRRNTENRQLLVAIFP